MSEAAAGLSMLGGIIGAVGAQEGAAASAKGLRQQAAAKAAADNFNAGQFDFTAKIAERDRGIALEQMWSDIHDTTKKSIAQLGQVRAAYGASGLSMEGSPLDVLEAAAVEQSLDINKTLYTGEVVAAGLTDRAAQARAQASLLRYSANNALAAGEIGANAALTAGAYQAASSIIAGASGAARSYTAPTGRS